MATATVGTDSLLARRIARAIVDFLDSVEPAPDVDLEGLAVAKDCIEHAFKLKSSASDVEVHPGLLVDLFSSCGAGQQSNSKPPFVPSEIRNTSSSTSTYQHSEVKKAKESNVYSKGRFGDADSSEKNLKDELLGKFFSSLDRVNFFSLHDGVEDIHSLERATNSFHDAYADLENAGKEINLSNLAEAFKSKGNDCLRIGLCLQAIDLYTCAIALCERNAVYYCNRAAAYTKIQKYSEAVEDCLKSIAIDPNYSKAYNCLGVAYDRQGKLAEALNHGFYRALELDPSNETVKENIRVTEQKLREENLRAEGDGMNTGSFPGRQSGRSSAQQTNNSFPFFSGNISLPQEITNLFENIASTVAGGNQAHESTSAGRSEERTEPGIPSGPEINLGHHVTVDIGDMPNQLSEILRAMAGSHVSEQGPPGGTTRGGDEQT